LAVLPESHRWILEQFEPEGDPWLLYGIAQDLEAASNRAGAASVYDRAFGIDPTLAKVRDARAQLLDELAVEEHGLRFRYVPAGPFLMGSRQGEPDELPLHPVWLEGYWLAEAPVSWADYCRLLDWQPPPQGMPRDLPSGEGGFHAPTFHLHNDNKIRLQYCEDHTTQATDWHCHVPPQQPGQANPHFNPPLRTPPDAPWEYRLKPMVAVAWQEAEELAARLTTPQVRYALPTEAQWEKAARGGLIGARFPWGDAPPTAENCDFGRFHEFSILPSRRFPPNGYGLYAMNGGVWEWTSDWYDCEGYQHAADREPEGPAKGEEKVLRGGSWADCAEAVTVSFRMSRESGSWREERNGGPWCPTIGFRLCRVERDRR
jgi:formylglycine-generating enzyme required for sulfatase activity